MIHDRHLIRSVSMIETDIHSYGEYPFSLDAVKAFMDMGQLELHPKVTFLVGENGSGKSTLLEAVAVAFGFNAEGGTKNFNFSNADTHSSLHKHIRITKGPYPCNDGFFLRAESFYNFATNVDSLGKDLLASYGGKSLHEQSHGESFFSLFMNRMGQQGFYILDEPEAALSPMRQLALISRINDITRHGGQFLIATHSPILMAFPDAAIHQVDQGFKKVAYEDTEHYQITRSFLENPKRMLDILLSD